MTEPTEEGLRRYPAAKGYSIEAEPPAPCTCRPGCEARCAGECSCEACTLEFSVFCQMAGLHALEPGSDREQTALAAYRG